MVTHYEVLGVRPDASAEEIKRAFYERARLYHPDSHAASTPAIRAEAERAMRDVNGAWGVLREPARRRRYDRSLEPEKGGGRAGRRQPVVPRATLGSGFQYWLGPIGAAAASNGRAVYSLRVTGARSLAPLASLSPDRLVSLHAAGSSINDAELIHLRDMRGLRVLDLTSTNVTDVGLLHLQGCVGLETLWLWNTPITDAGLALIARLPNLRQLGLGNTRITDEGLQPLRGLRLLRTLQLSGTDVEGPGLEHLHDLECLEMVTLPWKVRGRHRRRLRAALPPGVVA